MKTILPILLLTGLGLAAQTPPAPPAPPALPAPPSTAGSADAVQPTPPVPAATSAVPAALRRLVPTNIQPSTVKTPAEPAAPAGSPPPPATQPPTIVRPVTPRAPAAATPPAAAPPAAAPPAPAAPAPTPAPAAAPPAGAPGAAAAPGAAPPAAPAEEPTIPPGYINWAGPSLDQVLTIYAEMVDRSVLRGQGLPSPQLFFRNQTPLTKREAIQAIDALLAMNGIAMINVGDKFVKALAVAQAGGAGAVINTNDATTLPDLGGYHTHVVQLKYVRPSEVMPVIQPFASAGIAPPIAIESSQMLVIRDNAENVKRMLEMIEKVDVTIPSEFVSEVIPIKFAKVEDIAAALNSLSGGGGSASIGGGRGAAPATPVGTTGGSRLGQPYNPAMSRTMNPMSPQTTTPTGTPSAGGTFSERIRQIVNRVSAAAGGDLQIIGITKIVADARSNSLLVFATRQDMEMIKDIISKLDVVLAQVLIETIIMDVTLADNWQFGVSAAQEPHTFPEGNRGVGGYRTGNPFFNFLGSAATNAFPGGLTDTLPDGGFSYFGRLGVGPTFDVALKAAADDSRVNVIQRPIIQTSHATPAQIFVGNTVPYISGTYYGYGGYTPASSYQQLQVGISLSVTPFINADGLVVMQINETIDEISDYTTIDGNAVPNTTSRTLTAEVAVRDRETVMLGGFIRNSDLRSKSGVPYLKDIPLLGRLFSSSSSSKKRSELIVLMRPTVLRTPELAALQVTEEKKHLPGILDAEAHIGGSEKKKAEKAQRKYFNRERPFTPEEQKLHNQPAPAQP